MCASIICIVLLLASFNAGMMVGYKKAQFSYLWGAQYHKNFGGPRGGFMRDIRGDRDFINSHGIAGSVISVDGSTITIKGRDDVEQSIVIDSDTSIRSGRETIPVSEVKPDDRLVILGRPNDQGQIQAKFIRIFH